MEFDSENCECNGLKILFQIVFSALFFLYTQSVFSISSDLRFKNFSVDHGLSQTTISSICQDYKGFMWFGTRYGLNRYDAYEFVSYYTNQQDLKTINTNEIKCLFEDSKKRLWVGTSNGVSIYNRDLDNFKRINIFINDSLNDSETLIVSVYEDLLGRIWLTTHRYLYLYDEELSIFRNAKIGGSGFNIRKVFQDLDSNYYILNEEQLVIQSDTTQVFPFSNLVAINEFAPGIVWFGSVNHLNSYNYRTNSFEQFSLKTILPYDREVTIRQIVQIESGKLWIGTYFGILVFNIETKSFEQRIHHNPNIPTSICGNSINAIYRDKHNSYWIGTFSSGLSFLEEEKNDFEHYKSIPYSKKSINSNIISSVAQNEKEQLVIGTGRGGINVMDREKDSFQYFYENYNIRVLFYSSPNELWVGTFQHGLLLLNSEFEIVHHFLDGSDSLSLSNNFIYSIFEDSKKRLWVSAANGLNLLKRPSNTFKKYRIGTGDQWDIRIYDIFESQNDGLIIAGRSGISKYNELLDSFEVVLEYNADSVQVLPNKNISTVVEDRNNNWWIGTIDGLVKYSNTDSGFKHYNNSNGLSGNIIYCIQEDNDGLLWISTNRGLNCLNPETDIIRKFDRSDGLQGNEFRWNACYKCTNGDLVFGGGNGFNIFNPNEIGSNEAIPEVVLTNLIVSNNEVKPNTDNTLLSKDIQLANKINLKHSQNNFSIKYAALSFKSAHKNTYAYYLEGFDDDWNFVADQRIAKYTNIKPGNYIFRVKAANNDGLWNEKGTSIEINIAPAFWQTIIFKLAVIFLLILVIILIIRIRIANINKQKKLLEEKVNKRTSELRNVNRELEESKSELVEHNEEIRSKNEEILSQKEQIQIQLNELENHRNNLEGLVKERTKELEEQKVKAQRADALKSSFLANMSHEIRTPLNAIVGFSEMITEESDCELSKEEMVEIIQGNTESLLRLIDDILDLSKFESNQLVLFKTDIDINLLLEDLKNIFIEENHLRFKKNIKLVLTTDENCSGLTVNTDETRLRQILFNLLSNAFKFTEKGKIEFGYVLKDNVIEFFIKDSGIGIENESKKIIFDRFSKVEEGAKLYRGTGLGLSISEKLVEILGGEIWVDSEINKGSTFYFTLPISAIRKRAIKKERSIKLKSEYNWEQHTVLIAEDEENNYLLVKFILERTNAQILWAKNGEEAIELYKKNSVSLILMDLKMPIIDGYSAFEAIKELKPKTPPVIALTAHVMLLERDRIDKAGFDAYIPKPITKKGFLSVVSKFLNSK